MHRVVISPFHPNALAPPTAPYQYLGTLAWTHQKLEKYIYTEYLLLLLHGIVETHTRTQEEGGGVYRRGRKHSPKKKKTAPRLQPITPYHPSIHTSHPFIRPQDINADRQRVIMKPTTQHTQGRWNFLLTICTYVLCTIHTYIHTYTCQPLSSVCLPRLALYMMHATYVFLSWSRVLRAEHTRCNAGRDTRTPVDDVPRSPWWLDERRLQKRILLHQSTWLPWRWNRRSCCGRVHSTSRQFHRLCIRSNTSLFVSG